MEDRDSNPMEHIKNLTSSLTARDTVVNEMIPSLMEEAVKLLHATESQPKVPYKLSVMVIDDHEGGFGEKIALAFNEMTNSPIGVSLCRDEDCASRLCDGRVFNAIVCRDVVGGKSASDIALELEKKGCCHPFVVVSNGTETTDVSIEGSKHVYVVIDEETALNTKALEVACKQACVRHKKNVRIRESVDELIRLFGVMERVKCRLVT